jgi:hypothetical protein
MLYIDDMIDVYCMLDEWWMIDGRAPRKTAQRNRRTDRTDG